MTMTGLPQLEFLRVALTGGIATGKTYVLARSSPRSACRRSTRIVLAREVVQPGSAAWKALEGAISGRTFWSLTA